MIVMPRVDSGGRATAVVNSHYPKKLTSILRLDCVAGAHTCLPRMTLKSGAGEQARLGRHRGLMAPVARQSARAVAPDREQRSPPARGHSQLRRRNLVKRL